MSARRPSQTAFFLCWCARVTPTRNLARMTRMLRLFSSILSHIARMSESEIHARGRVNRIVLSFDKFRKYDYISVRNLLVKYLYSLSRIVLRAPSTTEHFTLGFLHTWNWMPSPFNMSWKSLFKNSLPLSVRNQMGRRVEYLGSLKIDWNADDKAVPVLDLRGTRCRNLEKTCMADNMYTYLSLYFPRSRTSTRSHSQTSITLFTEYGLRAKRFLTGLWRV